MNPRPEFFRVWHPHWSCEVTARVMDKLNVTAPMDYRNAPTYCHFTTRLGIEGLARVTGADLELLAVHATKPGTGRFRRFIIEAKARFASITLWSIVNSEMVPTLARYGFGPCVGPDTALDGTPSTTEGMRWRKADARSFTCPECRCTSYNIKDVENSYCGACHKFFGAA